MKILFSWLQEWLPVGERTPEQIAIDLESIGHEVEEVTNIRLGNVVVGEILTIHKHPNADKLSVASVDIGDQEIQLIFGQYFPVKVGDRLPVAVAPCRLPTGMEIIERSIRGVDSGGMLAADGELGRAFTKEGILRFDQTVALGTPIETVVNWQEAVLDIAITPNRGDVLSLRGLARDLAARYDVSLTEPSSDLKTLLATKIDVQNLAPDKCPRYSARMIDQVNVDHAPSVLGGRLGLIGHGNYNSVVDVTNYVMEEYGVPLHAFDADKVELPLMIRLANRNESIKLLDGKTYQLTEEMLVIADQTQALALAGIMGGAHSAVSNETTRVILEAASFEPASIRQTARTLKLSTDASYRFERGTDESAIEVANDRAAYLLTKDSQAQAGPLTVIGDKKEPRLVAFDPEKINRRLGIEIPAAEQLTILEKLGFLPRDKELIIPAWRPDVSLPDDLVEEVGRIYGYERLPRTQLPVIPDPVRLADDARYHEREWFKDQLVQAGWSEHVGSSFITDREAHLFGHAENGAIKLHNSVSREAAYLRPNLTLSLVRALAKNPIYRELFFFEIGTVFPEEEIIGLIWTGIEATPPGENQLQLPNEFAAQSVPQDILDHYKIRRPAMLLQGTSKMFYQLNPATGLEATHFPPASTIRTPSSFQPVLRDIALLVSRQTDVTQVTKVIEDVRGVVDTELFDRFTSDKLGDQQSLAFHVLLEHPERTLTNQEIQETINVITHRLQDQFQASIR